MQRSGSFETLAQDVARQVDMGENAAAVAAIAQQWQALSSTHGQPLRELIETLPFDDWNSDPWMLAALGASYRSLGSPSRSAALPYFTTAEALLGADSNTSILTMVGIRTHFSAALRSLGKLDVAHELAESVWQLLEADTALPTARRVEAQAHAALQLGIIAIHTGNYDTALTHLRLALGLSDKFLSAPELVECLASLSFLKYTTGDFDAALDIVEQARRAGAADIVNSQFGAPAIIVQLLIAVERNRLSEAEVLATRVLAVTERTDWEPLGRYAVSAISIINGSHIEGLDHIHHALQLLQSWHGSPIVRMLCDAMRATLLMHLGELHTAITIIEGLVPSQNHANCPSRFIAGIRFKDGNSEGCLAALAECELLGEAHSSRTLIDVLLLKAAANYELGNEVVADVAFDRALLFVGKTGIRTPFTLIPASTMLRMLTRASSRSQPVAVYAVIDEMRSAHGALQLGAPELLSEREKDVAHQLYLDKTVSEIAAELFISRNTVKTHVRSIYRKLGSSNRRDAIRRVGELGLHLRNHPDLTPSHHRHSPAEVV